MPDNIIIEVKSLSKRYSAGLFQKKKEALKCVSLQVLSGEVFGIVGSNGAGKSTLIKSLTGLLKPCFGTVFINGISPVDAASRKMIGFLPENPCLYQNLTITDHFRFISRVNGLDSALTAERVKVLLNQVRLSEAARTPLRKFSKGMIQRAALACALFADPEILILDEPMSGLDPLGRQLVVDLIYEYHRQGKTILFCSHILTDVERMCDRIGIMDEGEMKSVINAGELSNMIEHTGKTGQGATPLESYFLNLVGAQ
ncbi:MAG TPA: ABC transporter ATP-binding protein [Thermodesulfobacteriaceae bacterium]|nr:ABC transporter ATP-binding protein [Thermodesulfobacteriaceae bacterium]